ncbi:MAG: hypothetical protein HLUCCA11_02965 [Phormidesmis priestleyi Ana]|uniref:Uncharacterized protein n=1 Tax=Phormidesmis priestleyi Ana TaxID=1666911 RepID=A0A0P7ZQK0_9CYAN|nr:MAG: hypothetical protein HLUCCA11_02965 [Phormidesmis priestleyi Ana]
MGKGQLKTVALLAFYKAQPVIRAQAPAIYNMAERLARKAEIPIPAVYLVPRSAAIHFLNRFVSLESKPQYST